MGETTQDLIAMGAVPAHYAEDNPKGPAITFEGRIVSWSELEAGSNQHAHAFAAHGVKKDDIVTIALPNCIEFYQTSFAIWKLGATPTVVSPKVPDAEARTIVALANPSLIVGADPERFPDRNVLPPDFDYSVFSSDPVDIEIATYWKAMTSGGSTGRPKVIVDHMPSAIDLNTDLFDMPAKSCVLNPGPLYHNAPFVVTHVALFKGNHLVLMPKFDAEQTLELIEKHKVEWVTLVPTMMNRIWQLPEEVRNSYDVSSLRIVLHLAAPCAPWLKEAWINWLGADTICELYGGTETIGRTWMTGSEWLAHRGSVGRLTGNGQVKVFDDDGNECAPGEIGEIYLMPETGPGTTYHYIGAEPKRRPDGWESLGDIGWVDEDGYIYLADRRTDMIISGGENIYPAEIEAALDAHPDVHSSVVIGLPDDDLGQRVHAIVEVDSSYPAPLEDELRDFLQDHVSRYKIPRTFEFVNKPLRDDDGKVRRSQLRQERMTAVAD